MATTLKRLSFEDALTIVDSGGAFVDLRPTGDYLDVHVPGSIALLYEFGPGMASRARDCLPLNLPLILLDDGADLANAAASLRGKGFTVVGAVEDGINRWARARGTPGSTEVAEGAAPSDATILDVSDPGALAPDGAMRIPIERLWTRAGELAGRDRVAIAAGAGVRAAMAVGILERHGVEQIYFWRPTGDPRRRS